MMAWAVESNFESFPLSFGLLPSITFMSAKGGSSKSAIQGRIIILASSKYHTCPTHLVNIIEKSSVVGLIKVSEQHFHLKQVILG